MNYRQNSVKADICLRYKLSKQISIFPKISMQATPYKSLNIKLFKFKIVHNSNPLISLFIMWYQFKCELVYYKQLLLKNGRATFPCVPSLKMF